MASTMKRTPLAGIENSNALPKPTTNMSKSLTKKNVKEINNHNNNRDHSMILTELQQIIELNISNVVDKKRALTIINELRGGDGNFTQSTPLLPPHPPTMMATGGFAVFDESSSSASVAVPMSVESSSSVSSFHLDDGGDCDRPKVVRRSSRRASLAVGGQSSMSSLLALPSASSSKDIHSSSSSETAGEGETALATSISATVPETVSVQGKRGRGGKRGVAAPAVATSIDASVTLSTAAMAEVSSSATKKAQTLTEEDCGEGTTADTAFTDPILQPPVVVAQPRVRGRGSKAGPRTVIDSDVQLLSSSSSPDRRSQGDGCHSQSNKAPRTTLEASSPALSRRVRSLSLEDHDHDHDHDVNYYGDDGDMREGQQQQQQQQQQQRRNDDGGYGYETYMAVMTAEGVEAVGTDDTTVSSRGVGEVSGQGLGLQDQGSLSVILATAVDSDEGVPAADAISSRMDVVEDANPTSGSHYPSLPLSNAPSATPEEEGEQTRIVDNKDEEEDKAAAGKGRGKGRGRGRVKAATETISSDDGAAVATSAVSSNGSRSATSKGRRASMRCIAATGSRNGPGSACATATVDEVAEVSPTEAPVVVLSSPLAALSLDCEQQQFGHGHGHDHLQHPVSSPLPPPIHAQASLTEETCPSALSQSLATNKLPLDGSGGGHDHDVSLLSLDLDAPEAGQGLGPDQGQGLYGFSLTAGRGSSCSNSSEGLRRYQALLQWCSSDWCNDNNDDVDGGGGRSEGSEAQGQGHLVTKVALEDAVVEANDATAGGAGEYSCVGGRLALVCAAEAAAGLTLGDIRGRMADSGYPEESDVNGSTSSSPCLPRRCSNSAPEGNDNGVGVGGIDCECKQEQDKELGCEDEGCLEINDNDGHRMMTEHVLPLSPPSTLTHSQETEVEVELFVQEESGLAACCRQQLEVKSHYKKSPQIPCTFTISY